jgi:drug/metabolite transporter (DMT)-like permease
MSVVVPPSAPALRGILLVVGGAGCLTLNDLTIKWLSGGYPLHEIILGRSIVAAAVLLVALRWAGLRLADLKTRRWREHGFRVCLILASNTLFFLGLAALPLAEGTALGFITPLILTAMSVMFLGERVGPRRWAAVIVGLLGVIVMTRPGIATFNPAALLILLSACCYAGGHLMTRRMRDTETAFHLNFYSLVGFTLLCILMGLITGHGHWGGQADVSLDFLLRRWVWPALPDLPVVGLMGLAIGVGGLMIAQAYRLAQASLIAPFEYVALPLSIVWGVLFFGTWPDAVAWVGMTMIVGAGLYALWRETRVNRHDPGSGL